MTLAEGTPFIVFGDDWGRHVSTMQHVFRHIIPRYPVLWVNGIGHRVPRLDFSDLRRAAQKAVAMLGGSKLPSGATGRFEGEGPLEVLQPRVIPYHHIGPIHARNDRIIARTIREALERHGLMQPPVLVTGTPPSADLVGGTFGELASVYFCMDDFLAMPSTTPWMLAPLERRLLDRVDVVVATADILTRTKRPASGLAYHLPQGVNFDHFATPAAEPEDLRLLPRPRIGFAGGLKERCDLALLTALADAHPEGSVVLIGPVFVDTAPLDRPNVHVLGARPYGALPAYVQACDVGIVPYVVNQETLAVDPLKLLEYMAAGLPVVCTALPEAAKYPGVVAIGATREEFVRQVGAAVRGDRAAQRTAAQAVAREQTWDRRAGRLLEIIAGVVASRRAPAAAPV